MNGPSLSPPSADNKTAAQQPTMTSFFSFASAPVDVEIRFTGEDERKQVEIKGDKEQKEQSPVYYDGESVEGQVSLTHLSKLMQLHRF